MSPKAWLDSATDDLKQVGIDSARLDAQLMLEHVLKRDRAVLSTDDSAEISSKHLDTLNQMKHERQKRVPLAYVIGAREFYGFSLKVDERVLVPRPETELLVEYAAKNAPEDGSILELGTGSGAIALALASERKDLSITATDISEDALAVARENANDLRYEIEFIKSDLFDQVRGRYDLILANLPYVPEPARRQPEITFEPDVALYSGQDGLDYYRRFFADISGHLTDRGWAIIEFSPTQYAAMREEFSNWQIEPISEYIYVCKTRSS